MSATLNTKAPNDISPISNHPDVFLEGVGWVGGEEWLRYQFKVYLLSLLRSSVCSGKFLESLRPDHFGVGVAELFFVFSLGMVLSFTVLQFC